MCTKPIYIYVISHIVRLFENRRHQVYSPAEAKFRTSIFLITLYIYLISEFGLIQNEWIKNNRLILGVSASIDFNMIYSNMIKNIKLFRFYPQYFLEKKNTYKLGKNNLIWSNSQLNNSLTVTFGETLYFWKDQIDWPMTNDIFDLIHDKWFVLIQKRQWFHSCE